MYKKSAAGSPDSVDVFLYYWDQRDGPAFAGWWFGNQLGGTQVWSHNDSSSVVPPASGWKIPWDGAVRPHLAVVSKAEHEKTETEAKLKNFSQNLSSVLPAATQALEEAKKLVGGGTNLESMKAAEQMLTPHSAALNEAMKRVGEAQRGDIGDAAKYLSQMAASLRTTQSNVTTFLAELKSNAVKVEASLKQKEAEDRDQVVLQEIVRESAEKSNAAEDAVEKALITYEMVEAGGEDLNEVSQAVSETEKAATAATKAIAEARIFLNAKIAGLKKFETDTVRAQAQAELNKMQGQLQDAQAKLAKLRNVRQEFQQRAHAQRLQAELLEKLTPAEVDTDRAEEATLLLSTDALSQDLMHQAQQAVAKAEGALAAAAKFFEAKKAGAQGLARQELQKMEDRITASQKRLEDLKASHKEAEERLIAQALEAEATEKLQGVSEAINKAADAEAPFLMGVEELPLDETKTIVKTCEEAASAANTACAWAKTYLGIKKIDVRRFSPGPRKEVQERLQEFSKQLEAHMKRLKALQSSTAERRHKAMLQEVEIEVIKVEVLAKNVATLAGPFADDQKLSTLTEHQIRQAAHDTAESEASVAQAMVEVKKFLTARQIEAKDKKRGSIQATKGLAVFQSRLSAVVSDVAKYKDMTLSVEARLAAKKVLSDASSRYASVKEKVDKVVALIEALPEPAMETDSSGTEDQGVRVTKEAEIAVSETGVVIKAAERYIESQSRLDGAPRTELAKFHPMLREETDRLQSLTVKLQERQDKIAVVAIVHESAGKVNEVEEKAKVAGALWEKMSDDVGGDDAVGLLTGFETALTAAASSVGSVKTFLAMKRIAAKRLAGSVASYTSEELSRLQKRLEAVGKKTTELRKSLGERKSSMVKREVDMKIAAVEKAVDEAKAATVILLKDTPANGADGEAAMKEPAPSEQKELDPDEMKAACEKSDKAQAVAHELVAATSKYLQGRHKDAKTGMASDPSLLSEISKAMEKVNKMQAGLDKLRQQLRDQEHRFVANTLLQDATKQVEKLEAKLAEVSKACEPALADDDDFCLDVFKYQILDLLKKRVQNDPIAPQALFAEMGAKEGKLSAEAFVPFAEKMIEGDLIATQPQLKATLHYLAGGDEKELEEEAFVKCFRSLYRCVGQVSMTENMVVKGSKTVRKLQKGEIVEGLAKPEKEEALGLMRVKAKAEKDGSEGFITIAGNQGSLYLEEYIDGRSRSEAAVEELAKAVSETMRQVETRVDELKSVRQGPLADTKASLVQMKPRITAVRQEQGRLVRQMSDAKRAHDDAMAAERKRRQDAAEKAEAAKAMAGVNEQLEALVAEADKAIPAAEAVVKSKGADEDNPLEAMDKAEEALRAAMATAEKTLQSIRETLESMKTATARAFSEARAVVMKHKTKIGSIDNKCRKLIAALVAARNDVADVAHAAVVAAVRKNVYEKGTSVEAVFTDLAKGSQDIPLASFRTFIDGFADKLPALQLDLGLERYAAGVSRYALYTILQEYKMCVKDIAVTDSATVKGGKTLRKLTVGELVEVLEPGSVDQAVDLPRVRCRTLVDGIEGWVTLRGNQGTSFLESCPKPFYSLFDESALTVAFDGSSEEKRKAHIGEVMELLAGPKKEASQDVERVRIKAAKDGKLGWITMKDAAGVQPLEAKKLLVCKQIIAITTTFDISGSKPLRKLEVDETLEITEEAKRDEKRGLYRVKAKATRDGKEGWVTLKGNHGTAYIEESDNYYVCTRSVPLEARFTSGSNASRSLEVGEVVELSDGPRTEVKEGARRLNGRSRDGDSLWFSMSNSVQVWPGRYMCETAAGFHDGLSSASAKLRDLEAGEVLEALDLPVYNADSKEMRVRARARKDRAVGYATVVDAEKNTLLVEQER